MLRILHYISLFPFPFWSTFLSSFHLHSIHPLIRNKCAGWAGITAYNVEAPKLLNIILHRHRTSRLQMEACMKILKFSNPHISLLLLSSKIKSRNSKQMMWSKRTRSLCCERSLLNSAQSFLDWLSLLHYHRHRLKG